MTWAGTPHWRADSMKLVAFGQTFVPQRVSLHFEGTEGAPDLSASFEILKGAPECTGLHFVAKPDARGIRTVDLDLSLDQLTTTAFLTFAHRQDGSVRSDEKTWRAARKDLEHNRSGRPPISTAELEDVARIYRAHIEGAPTDAVAKILGLAPRTAARRVQRAREAGLLPPTKEGKKRA